MSNEQAVRSWLDISARVGDQTEPDMVFKQAVHLSLHWAQDLSQKPICRTAPIPRRLFERARSGVPFTQKEVVDLGAGRWPLQAEQLGFGDLPRQVTEGRTNKDGVVTWTLDESRLVLKKLTPGQGCTFVTDLEIVRDYRGTSIRVMSGHLGGYAYVPGTPVVLKVLSSMYGLFDGGVRLLPSVRLIDTPEDAETFVFELEDLERQRPIVTAVMPQDDEDYAPWRAQLDACAKESFGLQHVSSITYAGLQHVQELLGSHAPQAGCVKTYHPGFSQLDLKQAHPMIGHHTIEAHESGLEGVLRKLTTRSAAKDARVQREEDPITWSKPKGSKRS